MVVDTSALMAILFDEEDAEKFAQAMAQADLLHISAATLVEASLVAKGRGEGYDEELTALLDAFPVEVVPVTSVQAGFARATVGRYGKGHHPAGLNLGDLFAYALAKHLDQPLLFKGNDFALTDVKRAL